MKKRLLCTVLCFSIIATLFGCGKNDTPSASTDAAVEEENDNVSYTIAACLSESNEYNEMLFTGFADCLQDYLGSDCLTIRKFTCNDNTPSDLVAATASNGNYNLIFTAGKQTLISTTTATDTVPIVATGIVDFQRTLRIADSGKKSWDKTTGMNVTGVSSKPSIVDQVSLMIEATKDLQTVGILYSPEDTDAIYQNEIFEKYLDQAGIPWKEYMIPATVSAIEEDEDHNSTALLPTKVVASSAKSGIDNDVVSLGQSSILGINSPASTRTALVSKHWTTGKILSSPVLEDSESADSTDEESLEEENTDVSDNEESEEEHIPTLEERIIEACNECSAIYIPYGSMLTDQMTTISSIAIENNVVTVGGDTTIGANTLVTLFYDPYALGYAAGKKAVKILQYNGDISSMKISYGNASDSVKLYNAKIAEALGIEFPKSFSEINNYMDTYKYGSTTKRRSSQNDEEE